MVTGQTFNLIEQNALNILEDYEGSNNYILKLKEKKNSNKKFFPTRSQSEYIINHHLEKPKVARRWVELDPYFAKKIADDKLYTKIPTEVWVEKLLAEKEKSYHIWGKFFNDENIHDFWVPKASLLKTHTIKDVKIDYSKYSHRPPLEHQKIAIEKLVGSKKFILADDMGAGKAIGVKTLIYTPLGTKKMGDLIVGDKVIGSDGKPYNVIGIFPQGTKETYKITFNDGFSILTDDEHLWSVSSTNYGKNDRLKKSIILSTKQMFEGGKIIIKGGGYNKGRNYEIETYYKSPSGSNKWQIPIVKPIQFERNDILPIDPYSFGLRLGDEHTMSHNKSIPDIYKYSSTENRLSILQGLMDTDGRCVYSKKGVFQGSEYSTTSKQLCDDLCEIVHTLGGRRFLPLTS